MDQIRKAWRRIERWVDSEPELPPVQEMFNPPADPAEIDAVERALGHSFPASYRASLLVHDGQVETGSVPPEWLPYGMYLLTLRETVALWREERAFENERFFDEMPEEDTGESDRIRDFPTVTAAGRLPIAQNEGISYMYLDLVPGPAGDSGQVIYTQNECSFSVAGTGFAGFLSRYADLFERGVLRYDAETYACVVPADEQDSWEELLLQPSTERGA
ncbi:SMI1/KNR4 family protein [Actinoallomurus acaciae]|uniref:SMI1/KNR4 family protein n=1 Tax=Actinoallomurus acaciae TaxID=502577 RepID=A0ABV5Y6U5_9ACTN